jgi:hypothetical protein
MLADAAVDVALIQRVGAGAAAQDLINQRLARWVQTMLAQQPKKPHVFLPHEGVKTVALTPS